MELVSYLYRGLTQQWSWRRYCR